MTIDKIKECRWCGNFHGSVCPQVRALEYNSDGSVRRVEFFTPREHLHPELLEAARYLLEGEHDPTIAKKNGSYADRT